MKCKSIVPSRGQQVSKRRRLTQDNRARRLSHALRHGRQRRQPRQPHPGTRIIRCRCFLPDLAEFTNYRRGGTDGATINVKQ